MDRQQIGSLIRNERDKQKMQQVTLATLAGVRRQAITEIENATCNYGIDTLLSIAEALDLQINIDTPTILFDFTKIKYEKDTQGKKI